MNPARRGPMRLDRKMMVVLAAASLLAACGTRPTTTASAAAPAAPDVRRGAMLYENSCNACHTTQPHWRSQRLVANWSDLVGQVTRWQGVAGLNWTSDEIRDVAMFLNEQFYHLPCDACGGPRAALESRPVAHARRN